jgi:HAD superfamily hydrolase (TIGR01484 family)
MTGDTPIRMIVADIDGCLSGGAGAHFDHELLKQLAWANTISRTDSTVPSVTLCTGRPQPYVECLLQVIHGYQPALCESGTVFFNPDNHSILTHPDFGEKQEQQLDELRHLVHQHLVSPTRKPEPGKVTHITLIVQRPDRPEEYLEKSRELAARFGDTFQVELTSICVHFLFRHIHKGVGTHWLSQETGIPLEQMAGIGDAAPDLPFLKRVGFAWAPANAHQEVKDCCHGVSHLSDAGAAMELLNMLVAHNRRLQEQGLLKQGEVATR